MDSTLVTGMSGVGKTTVLGELRARGFTCIDLLLSAPVDVMIDRIRTRSHGFGQHPSELARILEDQRSVEPLLRRGCTHEIVTTMPVSEVVDRILEIAESR